MRKENNTLDIKTLENWLWVAACKVRDEIDAPKYKDYILPLIFLKRISDAFDDEVEAFAKELEDEQKAKENIEKKHKLVRFYLSLKFYGQEILHSTYSMAKMNAFIHNVEADIVLGDTMVRSAFVKDDGSLKKFDIVVSNPMWNQNFSQNVYENDAYNRFSYGYPPSNSADWGWVQHMFTSLNDKGRLSVVLDTGSVSRGSGNAGSNRERDIRKNFVENDFIEEAILLPENLFYNTTAPGIILIINKSKFTKSPNHKSQILLINASKLFEKGRPKNYIPDEAIKKVKEIYREWKEEEEEEEEEGISKLVAIEEVARNDYNLSPSRYVAQNGQQEVLPLEEAIIELKEAEEEKKRRMRS